MSWDKYFMGLATLVAQRSKDKSTQVGCVIVDDDHNIRATGYNGLPRGIAYTPERSEQRPEKYLWMEHADRNAIYAAARMGVSTLGCTMYLPSVPCVDCARGIVQAGIHTVVVETLERSSNSSTYEQTISVAKEILADGGVTLREIDL